MSFLTLNGLDVCVKSRSFRQNEDEIGSRGRSFNGTLRSTRRALKRSWQGMTRTIPLEDARSLNHVLRGDGDVFQFFDKFSSKGLGPSTDTDSYLAAIAADGDPVQQESIEEGSGAIGIFEATTNLSDITDTDGLSASFNNVADCTFADRTDHAHSGDGSVVIEFNAASANGNVVVSASPDLGAVTYTLSYYVKAVRSNDEPINFATGIPVQFTFRDLAGAVTDVNTTSVPYDKWVRVVQTITKAAGASNLLLEFQADGDDANIVIDSIQLELQDYASSYVETSRSDMALYYPVPTYMQTADALCVNLWARGPIDQTKGTAQWITLNGGNNEFELRKSGTDINFMTRNNEFIPASVSWTYPAGVDYFLSWHMYTCILDYRSDLRPDRGSMELWVDGVPVVKAIVDPRLFPNRNDAGWDTVDIGTRDGASNTTALSYITDVQLLPFMPSENVIRGWYSSGVSGQAIGATPAIKARGDFASDQQVLVEGILRDRRFVEYSNDDGDWLSNSQEVGFTLEEI